MERSGIARATSGTSMRTAVSGSKVGSSTSSGRRTAPSRRCRSRSPLEPVVGSRCAVTGVGPHGCQQVVVVVEADGKAGLAASALDRAVRDALAPQPIAAVLTVPKLPVDRRHNSKIDRTRLGRFAEKVLAGGRTPRRV